MLGHSGCLSNIGLVNEIRREDVGLEERVQLRLDVLHSHSAAVGDLIPVLRVEVGLAHDCENPTGLIEDWASAMPTIGE